MTPTTIKTGDTDITFTDAIQKDGLGFDLNGCEVAFWMQNILGGTAFSGSGTVVGGSGSGVQFPVPTDGTFPKAIGAYYQEWQVTTADETPLTFTFPEDGYNQIKILDKLS